MVASSLSTYLGVTQSSDETSGKHDNVVESPQKAAKLLVAVLNGTNLVTDLPEAVGMTASEVLEILGQLSSARLVDLAEIDGVIHVELTDPTKNALSAG